MLFRSQDNYFIVSQILVLIISVFNEEFLLRKFLFEYINPSNKNRIYVILFSSLLFTIIHVQYYNIPLFLLLIFSIGFFSGVIYYKFGFFYCILLHCMYNFFILLRSNIEADLSLLNQINSSNLYLIALIFILVLIFGNTTILTYNLGNGTDGIKSE